MINETVILLFPRRYYFEHRLSKYVFPYLVTTFNTEEYFYKPLQKIFSKVIVYDYIERLTEIGVKGVNEEIVALVRKERPKYVVWLTAYYEFPESTFESIKREGAIVVGWFGDDVYRFDEYSKWWIPYLDYFVTNSVSEVSKYRELGARAIMGVPIMGGMPLERDWSKVEEKYDISFVGGRSPYRELYTNELENRRIPVALFGKGWGGEGQGELIPFEEMIDVFKTSKINLNFSRTYGTIVRQLKGRIFEVCLAGGFLLTEYAPEIENFFEIDKEIVCFDNPEDMVNKVVYYLNHDEERRAIAQAGWKRATSEHSSFHMLSRVFSQIEEDIAARGKGSIPLPKELKTPNWVRKKFSDYYFNWGRAFSLENYNNLGKDALALSLSYNPLNIQARFFYITGFFPSFIRSPLFELYKTCLVAQKPYMRLRSRLLLWADSVPYLRDIKRSVARRFYPV